MPIETVLQYPILLDQVEETILSMFRIISTDASLVYPADAFLRSWIFWIVQTVLQAFFQLWEVAVHGFAGISKKILKKNSVMKSRFDYVAKRRI